MRKLISRYILPIIALCIASTAFAEPNILPKLKREDPDIDEIAQEITDINSPYYYPRLMAEFERNDTTMKIDKYRRLYIGYMLQEDYNPYRKSNVKDDLISQIDAKRKLTKSECEEVVKTAKLALANNPFDLFQMTLLIQALRDRGEINLAKIWQYKLNYLLMAIVSTGTGMDDEDAWWVIEPQHEYVLLNMMGYTVVDHRFVDPFFEKVTVTGNNEAKPRSFYFNIKTLLEEYYRKHPEEAEDPDAAVEDTGEGLSSTSNIDATEY